MIRLLQTLRPSEQDVREIALRETDTLYCREFEPIVLGPLGNGVLLVLIGIAAALTLPIRLFQVRGRDR